MPLAIKIVIVIAFTCLVPQTRTPPYSTNRLRSVFLAKDARRSLT
jgi:hypothetical protein